MISPASDSPRRALRRLARNWIARARSDRRRVAPFSYAWLNRECARLVAEGGAAEERPAYTWGLLQSAALARALGVQRITAIEFGVAGGRGLFMLERIAVRVETIAGVGIDLYGFDTGRGLPKPHDHRDLPNRYEAGSFVMDVGRLKQSLQRAQLVLGPVADTIDGFIASRPAPVAFISFDVDLYTSTMDAFRMLEADAQLLLPRVHCYMDDIMGTTFGDCNGERLAITDFNSAHELRKISPIYGLRYFLPWPLSTAMWPEQLYMAHLFDHPRYGDDDRLTPKRTAGLAGE